MGQVALTLAVGEYDRTEPLIHGEVRVPGVDLTVVPMSDAWLRHQRMIRHEAFDVAELSMSSFLMAKEGGQRLWAIPVFPYRMFRHQFVLVWEERVGEPAALRGKRVATPMYQTTTMLWVRGFLQHQFGILPQEIQWVTEREELVPVSPPGVSITVSPEPVEQRFRRGEVDALVLIEEIPEDLLALPGVRRLFPNYPEVEEAYYRKTGIYPMMHAVVFREAVLERHPWLGRTLYDAFVEALRLSLERERHPRVLNLAWASHYFERERQIFGGLPYVYGVAANRPSLEALVQYSHEQGLTRRQMRLEELFWPELMDT